MNIFKTMAVRSVEEATRAIPMIDFAPAFRGEAGALDAAAAMVRHACDHVGFFYMAGHGVPQAVYRDLILDFYNANCFHRAG